MTLPRFAWSWSGRTFEMTWGNRMLRIIVVSMTLLLVGAVRVEAQKALVQEVKDELVRKNVNLAGSCGAFEIVKRVVWRLKDQGYGFVADTGDTSCLGFSSDVIQSNSLNVWVDILGDEGGLNTPTWGEHAGATATMWRQPLDPGDVPATQPQGQPVPVNTDLTPVLLRVETLSAQAERMFSDLVARDDARAAELAAIRADLKAHDDGGNALTSVVGNRYVQLALGIAGAYFASQEMQK